MNTLKYASALCVSILLSTSSSIAWADLDMDVTQLQKRWAEVNYQLEGEKQLDAFKNLAEKADNLSKKYPDAASVWLWGGIIKSTYAGAKGGLGALKLAKRSKADLERAIEIEPHVMNGSALTSLGTLYFNVPGWPLGFGDDDKAEKLLLKALAINPDGIDSNYFYGDYLFNEDRYLEAEQVLLRAQAAPKRPDRPLADAGRQKEISAALAKVREAL